MGTQSYENDQFVNEGQWDPEPWLEPSEPEPLTGLRWFLWHFEERWNVHGRDEWAPYDLIPSSRTIDMMLDRSPLWRGTPDAHNRRMARIGPVGHTFLNTAHWTSLLPF